MATLPQITSPSIDGATPEPAFTFTIGESSVYVRAAPSDEKAIRDALAMLEWGKIYDAMS